MNPVSFPQANLPEVTKPEDWKDGDCQSISAWFGEQTLPSGDKVPQFITAWKPTEPEIAEILKGKPVYIGICANGLPPHFVTAHSPCEPQPVEETAEYMDEPIVIAKGVIGSNGTIDTNNKNWEIS